MKIYTKICSSAQLLLITLVAREPWTKLVAWSFVPFDLIEKNRNLRLDIRISEKNAFNLSIKSVSIDLVSDFYLYRYILRYFKENACHSSNSTADAVFFVNKQHELNIFLNEILKRIEFFHDNVPQRVFFYPFSENVIQRGYLYPCLYLRKSMTKPLCCLTSITSKTNRLKRLNTTKDISVSYGENEGNVYQKRIDIMNMNMRFKINITNRNSYKNENNKRSMKKSRRSNLLQRLPDLGCSTDNLSIKSQRRKTRHYTLSLLILAGDVEMNPGPGQGPVPEPEPEHLDAGQLDQDDDVRNSGAPRTKEDLKVVSYNVRGLNDQLKLRHLLNHLHTNYISKKSDSIIMLQETFIEEPGLIEFLWRGNFHLTPGLGNSTGCITLTSSHINIIASKNIGSRAHVLVLQKISDNNPSMIVANIYGPNLNREKIPFFHSVLDQIYEYEETYE